MRVAARDRAERDGRGSAEASRASLSVVLDGTPVQMARHASPSGHASARTECVGISYSNNPPCTAAATSMPLPAPPCSCRCATSALAYTSVVFPSAARSAAVKAALDPIPVFLPRTMKGRVSSSISNAGRRPPVTASTSRKRSAPAKPGAVTWHAPSVLVRSVAVARRSIAMQTAGAPQRTAYSPASTIFPGALALDVTRSPPAVRRHRGPSS